MRAHPAGPRHGDIPVEHPTPVSLGDLNAIGPPVWPRHARRSTDGVLLLGEVDVRDLTAEHRTPVFVLDEHDFRARCREFADAFGTAGQVHYAAKAFLSRQVLRWLAAEGLALDVCTGGELALALATGFPSERINLHGSNKSTAELDVAVSARLGAVVVDSFDEIGRLAGLVDSHGRNGDDPVPVMIRATVGVEAHTHEFIATAHEDQKFGFSLASGAALEAIRRVVAQSGLALVGLHSHIGSQIFDTSGFEVAAHRLVGLLAQAVAQHPELPGRLSTLDLGGGFGIAYVSGDDPIEPAEMARRLTDIVGRECAAAGLDIPAIAVEPGRAIAGPGTVTLYEVGTIKDVELDGGASRRYVSVDGGMSDNIRTALYDADYTVALASRSSCAPPVRCRVVGKHCESGDIVVRDCYLPADLAVRDLIAVAATGAYCYAMASTYNRVPRPPVVAVADGVSRLLLRRETDDDLARLEMTC